MEIYKKVPDDIQDKISLKLHKLLMEDLKKDIHKTNPFHNDNWKLLNEDERGELIEDYYPTIICYCLYDEDNFNKERNYILNPETILFEGRCIIREYDENSNDTYESKVLTNPTFGDVFMEIDKYYEWLGDTDHIFLEDVSIDYKAIFNNDIYKVEFFLGS